LVIKTSQAYKSYQALREYLAGYVLGDGNLYYDKRKGEYLVRAFDRSRKQLENIMYIVELLYGAKGTIRKRRDGNFYEFRIKRKKVFMDLKQAIKSYSMNPTIPFIAGIIDAEGYIHIRSDGRTEFGIANKDALLLYRIGNVLSNLGFRPKIIKRVFRDPDRTVYYLRVFGRDQVKSLLVTLKPLHPKYVKLLDEVPHLRPDRELGKLAP
jgi:hypothetical protein